MKAGKYPPGQDRPEACILHPTLAWEGWRVWMGFRFSRFSASEGDTREEIEALHSKTTLKQAPLNVWEISMIRRKPTPDIHIK